MFYRKNDLGYWLTAIRVKIPVDEGVLILDISNRKNEYDWKWHDEEPIEYTNWVIEQEQELLNKI